VFKITAAYQKFMPVHKHNCVTFSVHAPSIPFEGFPDIISSLLNNKGIIKSSISKALPKSYVTYVGANNMLLMLTGLFLHRLKNLPHLFYMPGVRWMLFDSC